MLCVACDPDFKPNPDVPIVMFGLEPEDSLWKNNSAILIHHEDGLARCYVISNKKLRQFLAEIPDTIYSAQTWLTVMVGFITTHGVFIDEKCL